MYSEFSLLFTVARRLCILSIVSTLEGTTQGISKMHLLDKKWREE